MEVGDERTTHGPEAWHLVLRRGPSVGERETAPGQATRVPHEEGGGAPRRRELLAQAEHGTLVDPSRLTVGQYLTETWLPALEGRNLRPGTLDSYKSRVRCHLVPGIGSTKLQMLDAVTIEAFLADLGRAKRLAPKTRRNVAGVLSKALDDARRWKLIGQSPMRDVTLPRRDRRVPTVWDAAQMHRFLSGIEHDRLASLWWFYVTTGVRRGEALGLRWSDLDLARGRATITNQRTMAAGRIVEGPPKTQSGARTVSLDGGTTERLARWQREQRAEFFALGIRPTTGYVFTGVNGRPLAPQLVTRWCGETAARLGLPRLTPHGLRHSAATWLIANGWDPKVVAQRFGHADPSITRALYVHVELAHDRAAADAFAAALRSS